MSDAAQSETETQRTCTFLRKGGIRQRMRCSGSVAANIEKTFVTVEKLLEAVESDEPLTDVRGVGPKTAEVITEWHENREEREAKAKSATVNRTSKTTLSISFHTSWEDALGIQVGESDE